MGITISATNSKYSFNIGYEEFLNLRINLAKAYDKEFGELYSALRYCYYPEDYEFFNKVCDSLLSDERFKNEDKDIIEFFFMTDCGSKINYKTCGKLYNLIKDIDFKNTSFIYSLCPDGKDYENLKDFLHECYSHRRNMYWR